MDPLYREFWRESRINYCLTTWPPQFWRERRITFWFDLLPLQDLLVRKQLYLFLHFFFIIKTTQSTQERTGGQPYVILSHSEFKVRPLHWMKAAWSRCFRHFSVLFSRPFFIPGKGWSSVWHFVTTAAEAQNFFILLPHPQSGPKFSGPNPPPLSLLSFSPPPLQRPLSGATC